MNFVVETEDLTRHYGNVRALTAVSVQVEQGSVFGILGPNGSGKTTCLSILLDVVKADSGRYRWFGQEPSHTARRDKIGALLETPNFYPYLSAEDNLKIACSIKKCDTSNIALVLQQTGLLERKQSLYSTYSLGMKQRLAIAAALLNNPEVLVLDEPTNGLDPQGIAEIRSLVRQIAARGKTILLASHMLDEVEKVCSHVAILKSGSLIASGKVSELSGRSNEVEVAADNMQTLIDAAGGIAGIKELRKDRDKLILAFSGTVDPGEINRFFFDKGITLTSLNHRRSTIENLFLEMTAQNG